MGLRSLALVQLSCSSFWGVKRPKALPGGADTSAGLEDGPVGAVRLRLPGADGLYIYVEDVGGYWILEDGNCEHHLRCNRVFQVMPKTWTGGLARK